MPNFAPIDYGGHVGTDTTGVDTLERAQERSADRSAAVVEKVSGGAGDALRQMAQGILHTQAMKATAAVRSSQAEVINYIESNPMVSKDDLQQMMSHDDYAAWHASLGPKDKKADRVPMYQVAGQLFTSAASKAREDASQLIDGKYPNARENWKQTAGLEAMTAKELRVDRIAAQQMTTAHRAETIGAFDQMVGKASSPKEIDTAIAGINGSPWLHPFEKKAAVEKGLKAKDTFYADKAMQQMNLGGMRHELIQLERDSGFKALEPKEKVTLANQLRTHINAAESQLAAQDDAATRWQKDQDQKTLGHIIEQVANDQPPPMQTALKQRRFAGMIDDPQMETRGFFNPEKQAEAYHLLEGYQKSVKAGKVESDPVAMRALTDFYINDPQGYTKAMLSNKSFDYTDSEGTSHHLNPSEDLSPADYKGQLGHVRSWNDTAKAQAIHSQEASKELEAEYAMRSADPTNKTGLWNDDMEGKYRRAVMRASIENSVNEATKPGEPLDALKRRKVIENAAQMFVQNAKNKNTWYKRDDLGNLEIQLKDGKDYQVPMAEVTDMKVGARDAGIPDFVKLPPDVQAARIREYHDAFEKPIEKVYASFNGGRPPTGQQAYQVYFEALKRLPKIGQGGEAGIRRVIMQMREEEAAKNGKR
jgi:hypothetical protein